MRLKSPSLPGSSGTSPPGVSARRVQRALEGGARSQALPAAMSLSPMVVSVRAWVLAGAALAPLVWVPSPALCSWPCDSIRWSQGPEGWVGCPGRVPLAVTRPAPPAQGLPCTVHPTGHEGSASFCLGLCGEVPLFVVLWNADRQKDVLTVPQDPPITGAGAVRPPSGWHGVTLTLTGSSCLGDASSPEPPPLCSAGPTPSRACSPPGPSAPQPVHLHLLITPLLSLCLPLFLAPRGPLSQFCLVLLRLSPCPPSPSQLHLLCPRGLPTCGGRAARPQGRLDGGRGSPHVHTHTPRICSATCLGHGATPGDESLKRF